ncbi:MAG: polysaccharide biosynthesis protein [Bacteroidetes bacterium]|nr:polysaccharide biosynthesis protein [Bacteroidota bacterium]
MRILRANTPRWIIFLLDTFIISFSLVFAFLLRFNFNIPKNELDKLPRALILVVIVRIISFIIAKTYSGIIRYTSTRDSIRIFIVILSGSALFAVVNVISFNFLEKVYIIPFSILIIDFLFAVFALLSMRILVKVTFMEMNNPTKLKTNIIIFGAGEAGIIAQRTLDRDAGSKYKVLAFIDEDSRKSGKKIEGTPIYPFEKLENLLETNTVAHVIISVQNLAISRKREIIEKCLTYNVKVLNVPPVSKWINGELSFKQIKKINIEDLLERDEIKLDEVEIRKGIIGKNVLVTGAAGSIGSELVRQICNYGPKKIILLDQAETPLFYIEQELFEKFRGVDTSVVIGDICNKQRMENVFNTFKPEVVYHAAAYKHVPMMENNPSEAIMVNVNGTKTIADLAVKHNVEKFVMVSTDKAVNPTNVMGASKRIAEIYTQSLNKSTNTKFITTRFGNVLGSNGSVIPLFRKQIEKGGPITITDPEVTRYFMTIPEACQLVLEAGAIGNGGEIFIFDMGKSVKILDLAKKMVMLSRLTLGKDIQIVYTGLRPGEKLYEELLNNQENTIPTHHPQIMIAKVDEYDYSTISNDVNNLVACFDSQNNETIVAQMKKIVPEFKSKNSVFEKLDV